MLSENSTTLLSKTTLLKASAGFFIISFSICLHPQSGVAVVVTQRHPNQKITKIQLFSLKFDNSGRDVCLHWQADVKYPYAIQKSLKVCVFPVEKMDSYSLGSKRGLTDESIEVVYDWLLCIPDERNKSVSVFKTSSNFFIVSSY